MNQVSVSVIHSSAIVRQAMTLWLAKLGLVSAFSSFQAAIKHCARANCEFVLVQADGEVGKWADSFKQILSHAPVRIIAVVAGESVLAHEQLIRSHGADAVFHIPDNLVATDEKLQSGLIALLTSLHARRINRKPAHEAASSSGRIFAPHPHPEEFHQANMLPPVSFHGRPRLIAIGVSTGGPEALAELLPAFPENSPPVLIVQHMPEVYTALLAQSLDDICPCAVAEAQAGDILSPGRILIAPGGEQHLVVGYAAGRLVADLCSGPPRNRHRPSVDVLFESVCAHVGAAAVGIVLTGMGEDGAQGLLELARCGARTYAQDERSSRVYGMPRAAVALGGAREVCSLGQLAAHLFHGADRRVA